MASRQFHMIEQILRRSSLAELIKAETRLAQRPKLSLIGPPTARTYRPSDDVIASASPATRRIEARATVTPIGAIGDVRRAAALEQRRTLAREYARAVSQFGGRK